MLKKESINNWTRINKPSKIFSNLPMKNNSKKLSSLWKPKWPTKIFHSPKFCLQHIHQMVKPSCINILTKPNLASIIDWFIIGHWGHGIWIAELLSIKIIDLRKLKTTLALSCRFALIGWSFSTILMFLCLWLNKETKWDKRKRLSLTCLEFSSINCFKSIVKLASSQQKVKLTSIQS